MMKHTTSALMSVKVAAVPLASKFPISQLLLIAILTTAMVFSDDCRGIIVHTRNISKELKTYSEFCDT
jgi:hypothetical protein